MDAEYANEIRLMIVMPAHNENALLYTTISGLEPSMSNGCREV